jgi:pimeloyl-ACP methyl ester carboxylesterase
MPQVAIVASEVRELSNLHGQKISIVGWSLGGIYARELAKMLPDRVRSVISLGSPFGGNPKSTNAWRVYEFASGHSVDHAQDGFAGSLADPPQVPTTAIYSRTDGIVRGEAVSRRPQRSLRALKWKEAIVEWRLIPLLFLPLLTDFRSLRARGYHSTGTAGAV